MKPLHVHMRVALLNARVARKRDAAAEERAITLRASDLKLEPGLSFPDETEIAVLRHGDSPGNLYKNIGLNEGWIEIEFSQPMRNLIAKTALKSERSWSFNDVRIWILGPGILQTVAIRELDSDAAIDETSGDVCDVVDSFFPWILAILVCLQKLDYLEPMGAPFGIPDLLSDDADFDPRDEYQFEDHYFVPAKWSSPLDKYFADPKAEIDDYKGYRLSMLTASVLWRARETDETPVPEIDELPVLLRASAVVLAQFKIAAQLPRIAAALLQRAIRKELGDPRLLRDIHAQYEIMWLSLRQLKRRLDEAELTYTTAAGSVGSPTAAAEAEEFRGAGQSILSLAEGLEAKRAARDDHLIESLLLVAVIFTLYGIAMEGFDFFHPVPDPSTVVRRLYLLWWGAPAAVLTVAVLAIRWRFWQWAVDKLGFNRRESGFCAPTRRRQ